MIPLLLRTRRACWRRPTCWLVTRSRRSSASRLFSSILLWLNALRCVALPLLAWAEGALGQYAQAEARLAMLLATAAPLTRVDALRVQGLLATMQGRWNVAVEALDEALERARAMPYPYAEAKTLWVYGRLEAARGDPAAARERFSQALAICDRLGEGMYRPHIADALATVSSGVGTS